MNFTYEAYRELLTLLREKCYTFTDYHKYAEYPRCVILRHDIDYSPKAALPLGIVEESMHVASTYFVLMSSGLYNPSSAKNIALLRSLRAMGHEIGLHFDEKAYGMLSPVETVCAIQKEADMLSLLVDAPVTAVSMHRPSKTTLEADLRIPGMVNSYGHTFFRDFKYLSDSRRRWREPVRDIVKAGEYNRLHILTHAFWYHEQERTIEQTVSGFIRSANHERYALMSENITDLAAILPEEGL